jgi:hypothetical protein
VKRGGSGGKGFPALEILSPEGMPVQR